MSAIGLREFHAFEAAGQRFLYLVPSAGVIRLDDVSAAVLDALEQGPRIRPDVVASLSPRFPAADVDAAIVELMDVRALGPTRAEPERTLPVLPPRGFPLTTMVLNVTSKCNLACTYCYEYGEDAIVPATDKPRFMSEETARRSVDWMFEQGAANDRVLLTFFGGETLLNFKVLQSTHAYAVERGRALGKQVDFSLTTNATLLRPHIIEWLAENHIGVTISIDGPQDAQDKFRVFKNGAGSYETVLPKIRALLQRHRSRPIGARVTLTRQNLDVLGIFRHLTEEIGFHEAGFAPVTTASQRDFAIEGSGFDHMLAQFEALALEYRDAALAGRHHGFSNVKDTLEEIHKGVSKAFPCGAGLGLMGVATDGDVALCHRFAGSDEHTLGSVFDGVDEVRKYDFLKKHHMVNKTDCASCWARPLCAGGCYHEAHVRYGDTGQANLHFCDWVRSWTDTCLRIYGELAEQRPDVLARFDEPLPLTA